MRRPTPKRRLCHPYRPMARGNSKDRRRGKPAMKGEARRYSKLPREELDKIDYKDVALLQRFVTERGKIIPRRISGASAQDQRRLHTAIKRARNIAMLPFASKS